MKLINSRGRTLLEVYSASAKGIDDRGLYDTVYNYQGPGIGGTVDIVGLHATIKHIRMDSPSAKLVGGLPEPTIR